MNTAIPLFMVVILALIIGAFTGMHVDFHAVEAMR